MATASRKQRQSAVMAACAAFPGAARSFPFGEQTAVFKVGAKIFAYVTMSDDPGALSVKAEPDYAASLVAEHEAVTPGYHLNKRHWVTIQLESGVPDEVVLQLVEESYDLVLASLTRAEREAALKD